MEYSGFFEEIELQKNGQYKVGVFYLRKDVRMEEEAFVDNASDARAKLREFRAQFKDRLIGEGKARPKQSANAPQVAA